VGFLSFLNQNSGVILALSNVAMAMGTIILALGIPWSIRTSAREEKNTFYGSLDTMYFELQKLQVEHPHLSNPSTNKTAAEMIQYDVYAYMVWNFMESIVDYSKAEQSLAVTWSPALRYEARAHAKWFRKTENRKKFKTAFVDYIDKGGFLPELDNPRT